MSCRIDLVLGAVRAAELINEYRSRLRAEDLLPDRAALAIACEAYADACVYVLAAPGQIWTCMRKPTLDPPELQIAVVNFDPILGAFAEYHHACGADERIPLDRLAADYALTYWPAISPRR